MEMKKGFKICYTVVFFLLLCLPMALMPFLKSSAKIEKRELAKLPPYLKEGRLNLDFSDGFESWINDRLPLRSQLLTCANAVKGELLHADTSNVIVGKQGWLFYSVEREDFMDTNPLTDAQIRAAAVTLSLMEENVTARGGRFTFVPAPNKSSVYGEYMPASFRPAEESNLTRLSAALRAEGVTFTDLRAVLTAAKAETVYHRRDSHWNYRGALIGYNAIMDSLGREHDRHENAPYTVEKTWRGDLDKLLYPAGGVMDEQVVYDIRHAPFRFTYPLGFADTKAGLENFMSDREDRDNLIRTQNLQRKDGSTLFMARDSFGRALLPYMIDCYENAAFQRTDRPNLTALAEGTDVVYEIAERNLRRVIETAPFMYAPEREGISVEGKQDGGNIDGRFEQQSYGLQLYGALPEVPGDGRVYLRLEQDGVVRTFEAFPIFEAKLLGSEGVCGYSAFLSADLGLHGEYRVTVVTGSTVFQCGVIAA